jgi:hypothetical protein
VFVLIVFYCIDCIVFVLFFNLNYLVFVFLYFYLYRIVLFYLFLLFFAQPFHHAVDPSEAPGYLSVITNPICLDDIEKKHERREYTDLQSFEKDLRQICANCMIYNNDSTWYYKFAEKVLELIGEKRPKFVCCCFVNNIGFCFQTKS